MANSAKIGRNKAFCTMYKTTGRRERNKDRNVAQEDRIYMRHIRRKARRLRERGMIETTKSYTSNVAPFARVKVVSRIRNLVEVRAHRESLEL